MTVKDESQQEVPLMQHQEVAEGEKQEE